MSWLKIKCTGDEDMYPESIVSVGGYYDILDITIEYDESVNFVIAPMQDHANYEGFGIDRMGEMSGLAMRTRCGFTLELIIDIEDWFQYVLSGTYPLSTETRFMTYG